jgi:DNA helicase-2/ATP-dependent DNA helicase PcrA
MAYQDLFENLSPEQLDIARLPASSRLLVLAGPGTGKTHTMIRRLVYLILSEGLLPHRDLLVVSFSRAAVAEIRYRLAELVKQGAPDDLRFLNIRTFDSLATRLLVAANDDADLSGLGYDARIALAMKHLSDPESPEAEIIRRCRHLMVDEIQDLVGLRAQLVQKILAYVAEGFTLLGDPAQGIYDYLVDKDAQGPTSLEFLNWVHQTWKADLITRELEHNYRSSSPSSLVASRARKLVLGTMQEGAQAYQTLREIVHDLDSAGSVSKPKHKAFNQMGRRITLLCRTNAEVLFSAGHLLEQGIPCLIPPSVEEKGIPAWVGRVFSTWTYQTITKPVFEERWQALIAVNHQPGMDQAWNLLKALEGRDRQDLNLDLLKTRLRKGVDWTFDSEAQKTAGFVLTTTIHQSKGREYDTVVILPPEQSGKMDANTTLEEARGLYVAATRAREHVLRLGRHGLPVMHSAMGPSGRERYLGQGSENEHLFETGLLGDIADSSFVSTSLFPKVSHASSVQELIWRQIFPGARMGLIPQENKGGVRLVLAWLREGQKKPLPLCLMDTSFRIDLEVFLRSKSPDRRWRFPPLMTGPLVYERRTLILPPYPQAVHEPYATSGFCLGVAIKGIACVG